MSTKPTIAVNGKTYKLVGATETEAKAKDNANVLNKRGFSVEIVKETSGMLKKQTRYLMYARER
jgi:hypothetical protein